ncbi:MAG: glycosyltransferase family 4 protein [Clostridium sp.]|nr:glycosyltransferase family 4 protein [Prevotella sp.]MCM1428965.1 glycosyltransferase family 4 protein [Clostridium sp.]MCM1475999.1 glycosyltransferase family 4 protein [Muribaculaceae bacterium]
MIVFVSNFFNHHQKPVADELYRLTDGEYRFIERTPLPEEFRRAGYPDYSEDPMVVQYWKEPEEARKLILEAETVVVGGSGIEELINERLKKGKLTFEVGERWLKRAWLNLLSPRLLKFLYYYHFKYQTNHLYHLDSNGYAASDFRKLGAYRGRCYKWGYFTSVADRDIKQEIASREDGTLKLIWVTREMLKLKRPDIVIEAMRILRDRVCRVHINMYGTGGIRPQIEEKIKEYHLEEHVTLHDNIDNASLRKEIRKHDVLMMTSNRREGWGAVINEGMSEGCAIIASREIGSVPFLIEEGVEGFTYPSDSAEALADCIERLSKNPELRAQMGESAYRKIQQWSPETAAQRLLGLIEDLQQGREGRYINGPCSRS